MFSTVCAYVIVFLPWEQCYKITTFKKKKRKKKRKKPKEKYNFKRKGYAYAKLIQMLSDCTIEKLWPSF